MNHALLQPGGRSPAHPPRPDVDDRFAREKDRPTAGGGPTCPACGAADFRKLFRKGGRDFWRCRGCRLERQHPLPSAQELEAYYEQSYVSGMYQLFTEADGMKRLTAEHRLGEMSAVAQRGRWLDVGCSNGVFVDIARQRGHDAQGIELSPTAVQAARQSNLPVQQGAIEDFVPPSRFDMITSFDVLEHVLDPLTFLRAVHRLLVPGGVLVLTVPNLSSMSRLLMRRRWYFYIPEEHLYYFNPSCIRKLLARAGFAITRCSRTYKPLTWRYSLSQLEAYNPLLHRLLSPLSRCIPQRLGETALPLYIGEMMVIARKEPNVPAQSTEADREANGPGERA